MAIGVMNPITSISSLSGDVLIAVIAGLVFIEESGIPVPFAPGDLLLMIAGIAIASDTVDPVPMVTALLLATILGAMVGREVFAAVGRPALMKVAEALRFRPALERATRLLQRGGAPAVFIGRLIPGLRIHTTQVAGVSKMDRLTFAAGLIPSVFVYIAFFVGLGALVGQPAVRLFHRAEHRFFVITVSTLATLAVVLSVRWLARRGALSVLEPIVLGVRREMADSLEAALFWRGENETSWRQYPIVRRLWAGLIDIAIVFGVTILILTAVSGIDKTEIVLDPEGILLLASVALLYRVPSEARTGQTIGKTLMGISVYGPNGGVPGWWRAAVRNAIGVLLPLWPIDLVLLLRNRRRQRLGDRLTRTVVRLVAH
jgi:membrane-associated protein